MYFQTNHLATPFNSIVRPQQQHHRNMSLFLLRDAAPLQVLEPAYKVDTHRAREDGDVARGICGGCVFLAPSSRGWSRRGSGEWEVDTDTPSSVWRWAQVSVEPDCVFFFSLSCLFNWEILLECFPFNRKCVRAFIYFFSLSLLGAYVVKGQRASNFGVCLCVYIYLFSSFYYSPLHFLAYRKKSDQYYNDCNFEIIKKRWSVNSKWVSERK